MEYSLAGRLLWWLCLILIICKGVILFGVMFHFGRKFTTELVEEVVGEMPRQEGGDPEIGLLDNDIRD